MLVFRGIQKTTLIDFPGRVACTLFLPGCDFRCPFCYNITLVLGQETGVEITEKEALDFLQGRKGFLDGVCITGGEPLLHSGLLGFCKKAHALGLLVKLDTNGSMPEELERLIKEKAVDYIAMDIKAPPEKYSEAAGAKVDIAKIKRSARLIMESGIDYEFRTTVVPALHSEADLLEIGEWLKGARRFFLQQFNPNVPLLGRSLEGSRTYSEAELQGFAEKLRKFFKHAEVRAGA
ncbi:MAG: anaerobic ribonucleoside-triphosphate reductase activating protein [Candidatus Diapherotrites archaeon]|nr:anaerobic ribonucleoside-triphosphate reductase activating protein [Candidatus Diapherotrites archaeon]